MPRIVVPNWRKLWCTVHLWLGLSMVPVTVSGEPVTVLAGDIRDIAAVQPSGFAGDRTASWIRLHEGSHTGPAWQLSGVLTGALSLVFLVTGAMMGLRSHQSRKPRDRASGDATMVAVQ